MHFSSAFVFVLVIVINLSGKVTLQSLPGRNYGMPPNNPQDEIINIGNGAYRTNVIIVDDNPNSAGSDQRGGSQYEGLGNRFGTGNTYRENQPNTRPQLPVQYHHTQVNNNHNAQSSNSGRTQTQGSASYAKNNGGTSFVASQGTRLVNVGYGTNNHNQIVTNNRPIQPAPMNSGSRTIETEASAHNARNNGGTSFVASDGIGVFHVGYGKDNHNQIVTNNKPIQPMNSRGRTVQTQGSAHNTRSNGGVFNVGHGKDNDNQIFVNSRPGQRTAPVNGDRRTIQTQSGRASNDGGYGSRANINKVFVNGQPIQPDHNDGTWSTYYTNDQRIQILNTGRAQSENKLRTLYGILAQILQIKSQLKQEAESLNVKV